MRFEQKQNIASFTLYDFICLFTNVIKENEDNYFDLDILIELIKNCKSKNKYNKLLENINFYDDFDLYLKKVISELDGMIIKYDPNKRGIPDDFDAVLFSDNVVSKNVRYISEMLDFIDDYYEFAENKYNENKESENMIRVL